MEDAANEQEDAYQKAGQQLRGLRQAKGMSQEAVCITARVDQSSYSKAERDGLDRLPLKRLAAIAQALDCIVEISFRPRELPSSATGRVKAKTL